MGVRFGPYQVPFSSEVQHFLITGSIGYGKTNILKMMLKNIAQRVRNPRYPNHRAVVLDPKRELYPFLLKIAADAAVRQGRPDNSADIVLLDWQIDYDDGSRAIEIIQSILKTDNEDEQGGRLRLMAIYTGEQDLTGIGKEVADKLRSAGWDFTASEQSVMLSLEHTRIVIYAKSGVSLTVGIRDRSLSEAEVPDRLIRDFAEMADGLVPSIALASLSAVRSRSE